MDLSNPPGIDRRDFIRAALAIGGTQALSACIEREQAAPNFPRGPSDLSELPERQFEWTQYIIHDMHGNTKLPEHHLVLMMDYMGSMPPTEEEREQVEQALQTVEKAYQRGTGGDIGVELNDGLLFMIGYSPTYFAGFTEELPDDIDLKEPQEVMEELDEDPEKADDYDAVMLMNADYASLLLSVEEALFGEIDELNGLEMSADFTGIFEKKDRRAGFLGRGLPKENIGHEGIKEHSPMSMGFHSGFADNLPPEDNVAINEGVFNEGSTMHISQLEIDLDGWYDKDHETRVKEMFSPDHSVEDVGEIGENIGSNSGVTRDMVDSIEEDAETHGMVGHTQKTAAARDDDFVPVIHRRSESISSDIDDPSKVGFNFSSLQTEIQDFIDTRLTMDPDEYDTDIDEHHHGIFAFLETKSRATFLVPPRSKRSLPTPTG